MQFKVVITFTYNDDLSFFICINERLANSLTPQHSPRNPQQASKRRVTKFMNMYNKYNS